MGFDIVRIKRWTRRNEAVYYWIEKQTKQRGSEYRTRIAGYFKLIGLKVFTYHGGANKSVMSLAKNIKDHLVRVRLRKEEETAVGMFKFGKRKCKICDNVIITPPSRVADRSENLSCFCFPVSKVGTAFHFKTTKILIYIQNGTRTKFVAHGLNLRDLCICKYVSKAFRDVNFT